VSIDSDIEKQVKDAEAEIEQKLKKTDISFPDDGTAVQIDGILYDIPEPVYKLIISAISYNQHLIKEIDELKSYIIRKEIMS